MKCVNIVSPPYEHLYNTKIVYETQTTSFIYSALNCVSNVVCVGVTSAQYGQ